MIVIQMKSWDIVSEKLDQGISRAKELVEALLYEKDSKTEEILKEKCHWWSFLSDKIAHVPVEKLIERARKTREEFEDELEREEKYCELLKIPKPLTFNVTGPQIDIEIIRAPPVFITNTFVFRWIYTFVLHNEDEVPGSRCGYRRNTSTLRDHLREGDIKKLFKRASYIEEHIRDGTPDRWSKKLLEVDTSTRAHLL
jgi:hypothetical protein